MNVRVMRRADGVQQITNTDGVVPAGERHVVMMTAFFIACGLFLSDVAPFLLVLGIVGACALGELVVLVDVCARLRRPLAEVHELARPRWPR